MQRGCTQCGECLRVCPVFALTGREEYAPKGKRILLEPLDPAYGQGPVDPALSWEHIRQLARLCAGCGRCARVCARKLSTAELLASARSRHPHWTQAAWQLWIRALGRLWPLCGRLAQLAPQGLSPNADVAGLIHMAQALVAEPVPAPWLRLAPGEKVAGTPVLLFAGCTARYVRPLWTQQAAALLRAWGYTVLEASEAFACCGGTLHHAGAFAAEARVREHNVRLWRDQGRPLVATFCASCLHSLRSAAAHLDEEEAGVWRACMQPLARLLVHPKVTRTQAAPAAVAYHEPCHWDGQDEDAPLLTQGLELHRGTGLCCGMGGILKMSDAGLSAAMARACLARLPAGDILTGCSGCVLQLAGEARASGDGRNVRHWLEVCAVGQ